jgi:Predicted membrane protein (DUF2306)
VRNSADINGLRRLLSGLEEFMIPEQGGRSTVAANAATTTRQWWRRPWMIPLVITFAIFLAIKLPAWLTLDPHRTPEPLAGNVTFHYWTMVAHILLGTITLAALTIQVWPWVRRHHLRVHRLSGRVYVFVGILPTAVLALVLIAVGDQSVFGQIGTTIWALLAIGTTVLGYVAVRQRRFTDHRKWMAYSFGMATNIITSRVFTYLVFSIPVIGPKIVGFTEAELEGAWLSWMINGALVFWYLHWSAKRAKRRVHGGGSAARTASGTDFVPQDI